jgi:hypothetical protein
MANPKFKIKHSISKKEWNKTHKDFKTIIDGVHYVMKLTDKGTALVPVKIEESVNEGISVFDERHFGKRGIIIMIDDNGKKVSAIFKDKKNADKFNRNNPSDIKKLLQLAKGKKFPQAIDESVNENNISNLMKIMQNKYDRQGYSLKQLHDEVINYLGKKDGGLVFQQFIKKNKSNKKVQDEFNKTSFSESVNEAKDPEIITQLRDVLKNGYKTLKDPKSGKRMKVDTYSASAIVGVYDKLNPSNKEKFVKQGLLGMQSLAFKFIK